MNYILLAIPFFFLAILCELLAEKIRKTHYYRVNDGITSLSAGIVSRMTGVLKGIIPLTLYGLAYDSLAVFSFPSGSWGFVAAFIIYDFFYYWNHRMGHEINLFWAAHVMHHSSEEYNLTTALRQTSGSFFNWIFFIPLAILGVEPITLLSIAALNLIYQFWVHTRHIPKLGWLEWILVTPSNHRVHHAQNACYIDRNYGGVLIIWDRMFFTFQEELAEEKPIYGIRKALKSWNPLWANLHIYLQLGQDCWRTKHWRDKFLIWFKPTGWRPQDVEQQYPLPKADLSQFQKFEVSISNYTKGYGLLQHGLTILISFVFLLSLAHLSLMEKLLMCAYVLFSSYSLAMFLEKRTFSLLMESIKNLLVGGVVISLPLSLWLKSSIGVMVVISGILLLKIWQESKRCTDTELASGDHSESI